MSNPLQLVLRWRGFLSIIVVPLFGRYRMQISERIRRLCEFIIDDIEQMEFSFEDARDMSSIPS
jgi:hypothetical protein